MKLQSLEMTKNITFQDRSCRVHGDGGGLIKEHTKGNLDRKHQYVLYVFLFAPGGVNGGSLPLTLDYFLSHEGAFSVADRFKIGTFLFFFFQAIFLRQSF